MRAVRGALCATRQSRGVTVIPRNDGSSTPRASHNDASDVLHFELVGRSLGVTTVSAALVSVANKPLVRTIFSTAVFAGGGVSGLFSENKPIGFAFSLFVVAAAGAVVCVVALALF